ncbi:MAG: hypothetical protein ACPLX8_01210, partial [Nanopusillaceae archaeon]
GAAYGAYKNLSEYYSKNKVETPYDTVKKMYKESPKTTNENSNSNSNVTKTGYDEYSTPSTTNLNSKLITINSDDYFSKLKQSTKEAIIEAIYQVFAGQKLTLDRMPVIPPKPNTVPNRPKNNNLNYIDAMFAALYPTL